MLLFTSPLLLVRTPTVCYKPRGPFSLTKPRPVCNIHVIPLPLCKENVYAYRSKIDSGGCARRPSQRRRGRPPAENGAICGHRLRQSGPIAETLSAHRQTHFLVPRLDRAKEHELAELLRDTALSYRYARDAQIAVFGEAPAPDGIGTILVATGGTSDIPVAEEAALTAEFMGNRVKRLYDVGVAGLHRLLPHIEEIAEASVIIAIAGMEGALASVIGGLADCPVIAVPTSVGYGASFHGVSALLSMLNSCASGVSVVNIDNGFGAGFLASRINHMEAKQKEG